ncbi:OsmC family protein [Nocardioides sp. HDW12B]|uniref:OsmC family protein n=1 Tax=Nocardioides sp. HDW12B TaxID=2714939 RepID=UPI0014077487|nr:OsmC family protein [Nocardioides sp. HDW12B]QIK66854.1 OsmC family protein [Nocardioides sp. HDW12B]
MDLYTSGVRATAGSLRAAVGPETVALRHAWTEEGVVAGPAANGAQVLNLSVALCVLNDTYREAERLGITIDGVAVEADGGFDEDWKSTGISYDVTIDSPAPVEDQARLAAVVDEVAEIPRVLRAGARVVRRG